MNLVMKILPLFTTIWLKCCLYQPLYKRSPQQIVPHKLNQIQFVPVTNDNQRHACADSTLINHLLLSWLPF